MAMKSEKIEVRLADIGKIVGGATPSTKRTDYYDGKIAWITPKDLSGYHTRWICSGQRNITQKGFDSCSTQILPKGSVLFSSRAPIGYVAIAKNPLCTNQGFKSIVPDKNIISPLFLYYLLKCYTPKIEAMASGTTFKEVSGATMKNFRVPIPRSLEEQDRIARTLGSLDDKIETNKKIIDNLDQQLSLTFEKIFLSQKRQKEKSLGELVERSINGDWGKDFPQDNYTKKVLCIRGTDINHIKTGFMSKVPTRYILPKNFELKKLLPGNLVIEVSGGSPVQSTGRAILLEESLINRLHGDLVCTNFCKALKIQDKYNHFFYSYWNYLYLKGVFFNFENGTTGIKNLDIKSILTHIKFPEPTSQELSHFNMLAISFMRMRSNLSHEIGTLSNIRDTLLPRLILE